MERVLVITESFDAALGKHLAARPCRSFSLEVRGRPSPQGSKKFVGMFGGHARLAEMSKHVKTWRELVRKGAKAQVLQDGFEIFDGPLSVRMVFTMPKPKSGKRAYPCVIPDLSKLARSTEDALSDAGVWADDARVVEYTRLAKVYPGKDIDALEFPGVKIEIREVELS